MNHRYTVPCEGLRIARVSEFLWCVECPGDASLACVARLAWDQGLRRWTLRRADLPPNSSGVDREWRDPSSNRPQHVPGWVESAVLAQVGAWALLAAAYLLDREKDLSKLAGDLAAQVRNDRDAFVDCTSVEGVIQMSDDLEIAVRYDQLLDRANAILAPAGEGEKEGGR